MTEIQSSAAMPPLNPIATKLGPLQDSQLRTTDSASVSEALPQTQEPDPETMLANRVQVRALRQFPADARPEIKWSQSMLGRALGTQASLAVLQSHPQVGLNPLSPSLGMNFSYLKGALERSLNQTHPLADGVDVGLQQQAQHVLKKINAVTPLAGLLPLAALPIPNTWRASHQGQLIPPKLCSNLADALKQAAQSEGAEAIIEYLDDQGQPGFAVFKLNSDSDPSQSRGAQAYAGLALVSHPDKKITLWPQTTIPAAKQLAQVESLLKLVMSDQIPGFDRSLAGTQEQDKMPVYQANLLTVWALLQRTQAQLETHSPASEQADLQVYQSILKAKLQLLPVSQTLIPGTSEQIGSHRKDYGQSVEALQKQYELLDIRALGTDDPEQLAHIEHLQTLLSQEIETSIRTGLRVQQAQQAMQMRIGSLASVYQSLEQAQASLATIAPRLQELAAIIDPEGKILPELLAKDADAAKLLLDAKGWTPETRTLFTEAQALSKEMQKVKEILIKELQAQIKVYQDYAPREKGKLHPTAQATVDFLQIQLKKIQDLDQAAQSQKLVLEIHASQAGLLTQIKQASSQWAGISPKEATALTQIQSKTSDLIEDYEINKAAIQDFEADIKHKRELVLTPPASPLGRKSMNKLQKAYLSKAQSLIMKGQHGSKLEQVKLLLQAIQIMSSPDTRANVVKDCIPLEDAQKKLALLLQDPELQAKFERIRDDVLHDEFGYQAQPAQDMADYILSRDFQSYLGLLPPAQQSKILTRQLEKLAFLDPALAKKVQQQLLAHKVADNPLSVLIKLPPDKRQHAIQSVLKTVDDSWNNGLGRPTSAGSGLATALAGLSHEEWAKAHSPDALYTMWMARVNTLPEGSARQDAIDYLKQVKDSGKLGSLMAAFTLVGIGAKFPPADFKGALDFTSSTMSFASSGSEFLKAFGKADALESTLIGQGIKELEGLGPIGDILGVVSGTMDSYQEFSNGDYVGGAFKLAGAGSSGVGVLVAAGMLNPVALGVATAAGLVFWLGDTLLGESEQATILRRAGVLKESD